MNAPVSYVSIVSPGKSGVITTNPGQPLRRIEIPSVNTLINKPLTTTAPISMVEVGERLRQAGITPKEPVLHKDEAVGIELSLNLFSSNAAPQIMSQTNTIDITSGVQGQIVGRYIPTNPKEAKDMLHLISTQRTGKKNGAFGINELKKIARNLDLPATGNKEDIANRIRTHIISFFNLSQ